MIDNLHTLNQYVSKYFDELQNDTILTIANIRNRALELPGLKVKWLKYYHIEDRRKKAIETKIEEIEKKYILANGEKGKPKLLLANEAKSLEQIKTLSQALDIQKDVIRALDGANEIMRTFSYDISNAKELLKLEQ